MHARAGKPGCSSLQRFVLNNYNRQPPCLGAKETSKKRNNKSRKKKKRDKNKIEHHVMRLLHGILISPGVPSHPPWPMG